MFSSSQSITRAESRASSFHQSYQALLQGVIRRRSHSFSIPPFFLNARIDKFYMTLGEKIQPPKKPQTAKIFKQRSNIFIDKRLFKCMYEVDPDQGYLDPDGS